MRREGHQRKGPRHPRETQRTRRSLSPLGLHRQAAESQPKPRRDTAHQDAHSHTQAQRTPASRPGSLLNREGPTISAETNQEEPPARGKTAKPPNPNPRRDKPPPRHTNPPTGRIDSRTGACDDPDLQTPATAPQREPASARADELKRPHLGRQPQSQMKPGNTINADAAGSRRKETKRRARNNGTNICVMAQTVLGGLDTPRTAEVQMNTFKNL